MTTELTRRALLKDAILGAGAILLGPALSRLAAHAVGDEKSANPLRLVFVTQSNGMNPAHICPAGWMVERNGAPPTNTKLTEVPLKDQSLHKAMEPLAPLRDQMTLIRGLSGKIALSDHSANHGALGCYPANKGPMAQTIDSAVADSLPGLFRHVLLGMPVREHQPMNYSLSASGPGKANPIVCSPDLAYKSLFGSVIDRAGRAAFDRKTNLLDFMAEDVRRSRAALAAEEREKFDQYVQAFETLHARQKEILARADSIRRVAPKLGDKQTTTTSSLILEAQFEIAAATLAAGLTNVVTLSSGGGGQAFGKFPEFNLPDLHAIGHGGKAGRESSEDCFIELRQFHCKLIAGLVKALMAIKEGNGTAMDKTLIVYLSDSGEGHHPRLMEWPVVLIGNLGGRLKMPGRFLEFPGYKLSKDHRTMASLYCTLLHAVGKPRDTFGVPDPALKDFNQAGPINALLA